MSKSKSWTKAELKFLHTHYGKLPAASIAATLGRSVDSVRRKAWDCSLTEDCKAHAQTETAAVLLETLWKHPVVVPTGKLVKTHKLEI